MPIRKLSALIIDNTGLTALIRTTQCITTLQRLYVACAPPGMAEASRVVNNRNGMLVIAADNGTIAAKLRQQIPRLLKNLQKQGAEITGIRVQVQVGCASPELRLRPQKNQLPVDSIDDFERLSKQVKDPGLRLALARFAARRRGDR